jgi:hypothetical protein
VLGYETLYVNYVRPLAVSTARKTVSAFKTTEIGRNRKKIEETLSQHLTTGLEGTPMELALITTSNFDYPQVITDAVTNTRRREIEISEEEAKQAMELLRADNRMKLAEKMRQVRAAEADAEAAFINRVGKALTDRYLRLREIEAQRALYDNVQAGDKVIVTNGHAVQPMIGK